MFPAGRIETQGQPGAAALIARKITVDRAQAVPNALVRRGLSGWTPGAFLREYTLQHVFLMIAISTYQHNERQFWVESQVKPLSEQLIQLKSPIVQHRNNKTVSLIVSYWNRCSHLC